MLHALRRLLWTVPLLAVVSFLVFVIGESLPGGAEAARFDVHANPAAVAEWKHERGLDLPLPQRYAHYASRIVADFDFGESYVDDQRVAPLLLARFQATAELALFALLIAIPIGIAAGVAAAALRGRWIDWLANTVALAGISIPVFWLGMILMLAACAVGYRSFQGRYDIAHEAVVATYTTRFYLFESLLRARFDIAASCFAYILLPGVALSTIPMAAITRMTRSAVLEEVGKDYATTARAKGLTRTRVVIRHALRNALIPIVTLIGVQTGTLLAGAALTETVFSWPGLGTFVVEAVRRKDSPALTGGLLFVAATFVLVNLAVDLLYGVLDPRVRVGGGE
ncbi:MAG: ABC transporter permease [Planctomycetes bacterium]|nr:ABC transporter permease [Planctomycetota bacterium]